MLCLIILYYYSILHDITLLHCITLYYILLHYIILCYIILHYILLCYITLYYVMLLYCIISYYIMLCYTILYYIFYIKFDIFNTCLFPIRLLCLHLKMFLFSCPLSCFFFWLTTATSLGTESSETSCEAMNPMMGTSFVTYALSRRKVWLNWQVPTWKWWWNSVSDAEIGHFRSLS